MSIIDGIKLPNGNTYNVTLPLVSSGFTTTAGNSTSGSYLAAKWAVNGVNGITTPVDGMTIAVRVPLAGNSGGVLLSIDNGSNYYPIVRNVNSLVTTQYGVGSTIVVTFNSTQTAKPYVTSNTATTVTGCWQIADYDANTKNSTGTSEKTATKLYLAGATSQNSSGTTTYSNKLCYVGTDNCLYTGGKKAANTDVATTSANGLMSSSDKTKLDGVADNANNYSLPTASSSTLGGVKVGSNLSISSGVLSVPTASGTQAGATIVYPAASCTTFSSDTGTITPLAAQKAAKMFSITRPQKKDTAETTTDNAIVRWDGTSGDVQDSKIIIEDVTNTRDTSKKAQVIAIPAEGDKKMVYGYCTDQIDGTSFIGGVFDKTATAYPYNQGLAIGGTSGNLLWKGKRVLDNDDLTTINSSISGKASSSHTHNYAGSASAGGAANSSVSDTPITTAGTGSAYTATVPGITALTAGVSFIMVPNVVSASTSPTLNVNSLGAKSIKRRLSNLSTSVQNGYTSTWLAASKPFRVTYDGSYWIAEGLEKPVSADLYGAVPVANGGTGATTAAAALTNLGITYGTTDLTAGTSALTTGAIYLVYE